MLFHYSRVDAEKLSLLSDKELRLLAEKMGIYVPEGLDRLFLIEEIIEAFEDDTAEKSFSHDAPDHVEEKKLTGTGFIPGRLEEIAIPDRYNETYLVAIVRDPLWIFHSGISLRVQKKKLSRRWRALSSFCESARSVRPNRSSTTIYR